jgi:hypothetical protein
MSRGCCRPFSCRLDLLTLLYKVRAGQCVRHIECGSRVCMSTSFAGAQLPHGPAHHAVQSVDLAVLQQLMSVKLYAMHKS